jgi:hypothetical protein
MMSLVASLGSSVRWISQTLLIVASSLGAWCGGHERQAPPPPPPSVATPQEVKSAAPSTPAPSAAEEAPAASGERDRECNATVDASMGRVRAVVTDYDHYATIMPKFGRSRVLKRGADGAEVYLQVPLLHGAASLWAVVRFAGPITTSDGEQIEGNYLHQGNVSNFHCVWSYSRIDDTHTQLHLALLLLPAFPLPESLLDSELNDACRDALGGVKSAAESGARGPSSGPSGP